MNKKQIVVAYDFSGEPILEEGVEIKTADPRITGKIFEIDGKYFVRDTSGLNEGKWFNRLNEAIHYCQPNMRLW